MGYFGEIRNEPVLKERENERSCRWKQFNTFVEAIDQLPTPCKNIVFL